jgi:tetratricopeptide (TPR) repeat protein
LEIAMPAVITVKIIAMVLVGFFLSVPHAALAQGLDEAAALNQQVTQLYNQGRYSEAIPLAQRVLTMCEKAFGPDHPDVATSLNNLAELYRVQGRYADAERLYERSLAIRWPGAARKNAAAGALADAVELAPFLEGENGVVVLDQPLSCCRLPNG